MIGPITIPKPPKYTVAEMIAALKNRPQITFGNVTMMDNVIADQIITILESVQTAIVNSAPESVNIKEALHLPVDSGGIAVLSFALVRKYKGELNIPETDYKVIPLLPGKYKVRVKIPKSWLDNKIDETFEVTVGENDGIVIGDACYYVKEWSKFLDDTDYLNSIPEGQGMSINTGGDGTFKTAVEITNA